MYAAMGCVFVEVMGDFLPDGGQFCDGLFIVDVFLYRHFQDPTNDNNMQ